MGVIGDTEPHVDIFLDLALDTDSDNEAPDPNWIQVFYQAEPSEDVAAVLGTTYGDPASMAELIMSGERPGTLQNLAMGIGAGAEVRITFDMEDARRVIRFELNGQEMAHTEPLRESP